MDQEKVHTLMVPMLEKASLVIVSGPSGCGKKYVIKKALATKYTNEQRGLMAGEHPDHTIVDGSTLKLEDLRMLKGSVYQGPAFIPYRYTTIEHADRLTFSAVTVMLKILEETPAHHRWFITATRADSLLETVKSRGYLLTMTRLSEDTVVQVLRDEGVDKPLTRAKWCGGDLNFAREMDPAKADEWGEWWSQLYNNKLNGKKLVEVLAALDDAEYDYTLMRRVGGERLKQAMIVDSKKWEKHFQDTMALVRDEEYGKATKYQKQAWLMEAFAVAKARPRDYTRATRR